MLSAMDKDRSVMKALDARPGAPTSDRGQAQSEPKTALTRVEPSTISAAVGDREPHAAQPVDRVEGRAEPAGVFSSVLCGVDRSVDSRAAHRQAVLLASPAGAVEIVPAPQLTRHGAAALHDACKGRDLLALGAGAGAHAVVKHARIPVLIGRWNPLEAEVTDTILVAVDDSPESCRAVALAGRLAAARGGTVTVLLAPPRDPGLQRAVAASRRILLQITGASPTLLGEQLPRERVVPATAVAISASLVVLGTGDSENVRRTTAQIADGTDSSVLTVPRPDRAEDTPVGATWRAA
jgi:nucleotide-binding universal stress UspA family protein